MLQTERVKDLEEVRQVVLGTVPIEFKLTDRESAYGFIRRTLVQFDYARCGKSDKGVLKAYLSKLTGLSRAQLTRLIAQHRQTGEIVDHRRQGPARPFERRYRDCDIRLLAETDEVYGQMSGPATRKVLRRMFQVHRDARYERLSRLSNGHLYTLRQSRAYRIRRAVYRPTRPTPVAIGRRAKPDPGGEPGFLRVDTVHQGDRDRVKGIYLINTVDEITQYQHVGAVSAISERFLVPVLHALLEAYPFVIRGFHSDNGTEFVNRTVARLLNKLHVEFTKSRSRRSNDNALVEGKNGSVVRRHLGYDHIPRQYADLVNAFTQDVFSPWLNYHRPCLFARERRDSKGKMRRYYPDRDVATPYEKFRSLGQAERHLKPGIHFEHLDAIAQAENDIDATRSMNRARDQLFKTIFDAQSA